MATKSLVFCLVAIFSLSSIFALGQSRPFRAIKKNCIRGQTKIGTSVIIKDSGHSLGSEYHHVDIHNHRGIANSDSSIKINRYPQHATFQTITGIKNSGPSPGGENHRPSIQALGGIKNSGPSPGGGNHRPSIQALGGIKNSGPSPCCGNHRHSIQTLGGIKNSGPSPGQGNKFITGMHA